MRSKIRSGMSNATDAFTPDALQSADVPSIRDGVDARLARTHGAANRGQLGAGTIIAAFLLVVIGMALVFVLDIFDGAIGSPSNSSLSTSQDSMLSGFSSLSDLIEPIVVIAGVVVIIGLVRRVQG